MLQILFNSILIHLLINLTDTLRCTFYSIIFILLTGIFDDSRNGRNGSRNDRNDSRKDSRVAFQFWPKDGSHNTGAT